MKIYFIRHGKTQWNLEGRFQGYSGDSDLLPEAIEEVQHLGQHLARVICSVLKLSTKQPSVSFNSSKASKIARLKLF